MAISRNTIDFILDQLSALPKIRARKMFGEYALYCDEKVVALVCDDQLFIKITTSLFGALEIVVAAVGGDQLWRRGSTTARKRRSVDRGRRRTSAS